MTDIDIHEEWITHPVVEHALDTHGGLNVGSLQMILDTVDQFEERFPGVKLDEVLDPNPDVQRIGQQLIEAGTSPADVVFLFGDRFTIHQEDRLYGSRDADSGLTPADTRTFELADSGLTRSQMIEAFGCKSRAAIEASAIRNPMTPEQCEDVLVKDKMTYVEASEVRGRSVYTIQNSVLKDRYHRSRALHAYTGDKS